jgi:methyl-accepting chemotaxis protein
VGAVAIYQQNRLAELTELMHRHPLAVTDAVLSIKAELLGMHRSMKDVALASQPSDIDEAEWRVDTGQQHVHDSSAIIRERYLGEETDVREVELLFHSSIS